MVHTRAWYGGACLCVGGLTYDINGTNGTGYRVDKCVTERDPTLHTYMHTSYFSTTVPILIGQVANVYKEQK